MKKIFDTKIERFEKTSINDLIEIAETSIKHAKIDAIITLGQRIYESKTKILEAFDRLLVNKDNFNFISMNLPPNFLVIIMLIENLKENDYSIVKERFVLWNNEEKNEFLKYLKDFPDSLNVLTS